MEYLVTSDNVKVLGRTKLVDNVLYLNYSLSSIEFIFTGKKVEVILVSDIQNWEPHQYAWMAVFVNDEMIPSKRFCISSNIESYVLYESKEVETVTIRLVKMSEAAFAKVGVKSICVVPEGKIRQSNMRERRIEFIGDSITCGYGNEGICDKDTFTTAQENPLEAFAGLTTRALEADCQLVSWSGIGVLSSWTNEDKANTNLLMPKLYQYTDLGLEDSLHNQNPEWWDHKRFIPDIIVVNLGTNDNSYCKGIKERVKAFGDAYFQFLSYIRCKNKSSVILCTLGAMGQELCEEIERQVETFQYMKEDRSVYSMRFDVQKESDGIGTDWHPNKVTHTHMAMKLTSKIKEIMNW